MALDLYDMIVSQRVTIAFSFMGNLQKVTGTVLQYSHPFILLEAEKKKRLMHVNNIKEIFFTEDPQITKVETVQIDGENYYYDDTRHVLVNTRNASDLMAVKPLPKPVYGY